MHRACCAARTYIPSTAAAPPANGATVTPAKQLLTSLTQAGQESTHPTPTAFRAFDVTRSRLLDFLL